MNAGREVLSANDQIVCADTSTDNHDKRIIQQAKLFDQQKLRNHTTADIHRNKEKYGKDTTERKLLF